VPSGTAKCHQEQRSATTANLTSTGRGLILAVGGERPSTSRLNHGTPSVSVAVSGRWMVRVSARTPTVPTVTCHGFPQAVQKNAWIIRVSTEQLPSRCLPVHHSQINPRHTLRMREMCSLERHRITVEQTEQK
jgi:hypothetical protein